MQHIDIDKKRPSIWPWITGLVVVALVFWGVTILLTPDPEAEPEVAVETVADTHPPAAIPSPPNAEFSTSATRPVEEIAPLGEEDVGEIVRVEGEVLATGNSGFWLLTGADVIRIDSERHVRKGDTLAVEGTLAEADPEKTDLIAEAVLARDPAMETWNIVRPLKLVEGPAAAAGGDGAGTTPSPRTDAE